MHIQWLFMSHQADVLAGNYWPNFRTPLHQESACSWDLCLWSSSPPLVSLSKTLIIKVPVTFLPQRHKSAWSQEYKVLTQFNIRFITAILMLYVLLCVCVCVWVCKVMRCFLCIPDSNDCKCLDILVFLGVTGLGKQTQINTHTYFQV